MKSAAHLSLRHPGEDRDPGNAGGTWIPSSAGTATKASKPVVPVTARWLFFWVGILLLVSFLCSCDFARMRDDEAVEYYDMRLPDMPPGVVPLGGGAHPVLAGTPDQVQNPLPPTPAVIRRGETAYVHFCRQCHGPEGKGFGTVGQSFAPLPTDLRSEHVQSQSDGELFLKIGRGFLRHPPLAYTVSVEDRWAVVAYMRAMKEEGEKEEGDKARKGGRRR